MMIQNFPKPQKMFLKIPRMSWEVMRNQERIGLTWSVKQLKKTVKKTSMELSLLGQRIIKVATKVAGKKN